MAFVHRIARYCACGFLFLSLGAPASEVERTGGPYVPTPQAVVDAMLELAKVSADDFVVDLGSGDGRIVLTAALRYSASGLGIDIDPELVESSNGEAQKRGIGERIRFIQQDVLKANVAEATVLTLYLLPGMMQSLQSKLSNELRPGTRIVSHDFTFGDWKADREVSIDIPEKYGSPGQWKSTIYYWLVPARVQGQWELTAPELVSAPAPLLLTQRYQAIEGVVNARGRRVPISAGRMEADRVEFKLRLPGGLYAFRGSVHGDRMHGEASSGERVVRWSAVRAPDTGAH